MMCHQRADIKGPDRSDRTFPCAFMTEPAYTCVLITLQRSRETSGTDGLGEL